MARLETRSLGLGSATLANSSQLTGQTSSGMPFIAGRFSAFDSWTEIQSASEGRFLERIARGAFARTIQEHRSAIRILYSHGMDPFIGSRPIAPLDGIGEDERGGWYMGRLFDTVAAREIAPILAAGQLGSSFRFSVISETWADNPTRSAANPDGLRERTVIEARVYEVGPTPFPAYADTPTGTSTGEHPPRSRRRLMSDAEWQQFLVDTAEGRLPDSSADKAARQRWLDKVMPIPAIPRPVRAADRERWAARSGGRR